MKKIILYSIAVFSAASLLLSCQKNQETIDSVQNHNLQTLTVTFPSIDGVDTKVTNNLGTTGWQAGDKLIFQGCPKVNSVAIAPVVHELTAAEITDPEKAVITVDLSSLSPDESTPYEINVAYPADVWSSYSSSHTYGRSRFTDATNQLLMAGYLDGNNIVLNHLTAVLFFKVPASLNGLVDSYTFSGKNGETLGYGKYLVEINSTSPSYLAKLGTATYGTLDPITSLSGPVVADGTTVHAIYFQNEIDLTNGFTLMFNLGGEPKKTISASAELHLVHGHGVNLGLLPEANIEDYKAPATHDSKIPTSGATALDGSGTANCYIVSGASANQVFTFTAYKGNSSVSVGDVLSADILWETMNNTDEVTENSVIAAVDFEKKADKDYYTMVFKMPESIKAGNALIAAKGAGGKILWSWHIWIPTNAIATSTYEGVAATPMMDRNLGALVAATAGNAAPGESIGLLYQWGRKDPFPGTASVSSSTPISTSKAITYESSKTNFTVEETIQNPTTYVKTGGDSNKTWMTAEEKGNDYWGTTKTIYDPCPAGYMVPTRDKTNSLLWAGTAVFAVDDTNKLLSVSASNTATEVAVFPIAGYLDQGEYCKVGTRMYLWSSYASSGDNDIAYYMYANGSSVTIDQQRMSRGGNIRCVAIPE